MDKKRIKKTWMKFYKSKSKYLEKKIVTHYLPLLSSISGNMRRNLKYKVTQEELESFGYDGLISAVKKFDPLKGAKFETYANIRVFGSIIDGLRRIDWIPRNVRIRHSALEKTKYELEAKENDKV